MDRRRFLTAAAAAGLAAAAGPTRVARAAGTTKSVGNPASNDRWRRFEVHHSIELAEKGGNRGPARLWVPVAQTAGDYQRAHDPAWSSTADRAALLHDPLYGAGMLRADWDGAGPRTVELVQIVETRDRTPGDRETRPADPAELWLYRQPTPSMPTDGIVRDTAMRIVAGIDAPEARLRAIYDWVVDNSFRDAATRGCGLGNIATMLETGYLGGKCADINGLMVGLARAAGFPAREVYGIRVADSALAKSLGRSGDISKAQHCRAEVHLDGRGWFAVDPADVCKVMLEEGLGLGDPRVAALRERLFGSWEMNWIGYNSARDFQPAGAPRPLGFLMYPYAVTTGFEPDCLDPATFRYGITARELPA